MATPKPDVLYPWAETGGITDPGVVKTQEGWVSEIPTFQVFNWVLNRSDQFNKHVNLNGVPEWDAVTTYDVASYVKASNGEIYRAITGANQNKNPILDTTGTDWKPLRSFDILGKDLKTVIAIGDVAGAVNYIFAANSTTGNKVGFIANGTDANVGFSITAKGNGDINLNTNGYVNVTGGKLKLSSFDPSIEFVESEQGGFDAMIWKIKVDNTTLSIQTYTDTGVFANNAISIVRNGPTITNIDLNAATVKCGNAVEAIGVNPRYRWYETDGPVNEKYWDITAETGGLYFRTLSDALGGGQDYFIIQRTGTVVDSVTLNATNIITTGQVTLNAATTISTATFVYVEDGDGLIKKEALSTFLLNSNISFRGALVYKTLSVQTIANATDTPLTWNTVAYDTDNIYSAGANTRLTVPANTSRIRLSFYGVWDYVLNAYLACWMSKNRAAAPYTTNGVGLPKAVQQPMSNQALDRTMSLTSAIIDVVPGDFFQIIAHQISGGNLQFLYYVTAPADATSNPYFAMEIIE